MLESRPIITSPSPRRCCGQNVHENVQNHLAGADPVGQHHLPRGENTHGEVDDDDILDANGGPLLPHPRPGEGQLQDPV